MLFSNRSVESKATKTKLTKTSQSKLNEGIKLKTADVFDQAYGKAIVDETIYEGENVCNLLLALINLLYTVALFRLSFYPINGYVRNINLLINNYI